jgi:uncharacterized membrane protein (UPF0127 family)
MGKNLLLFIFFFISTCASILSANEIPFYKTAVFPSGTKMQMEIADTDESRRKGLMFRDHLTKGTGMLFIFSVSAPHRFWMKNCKFPIDIIWLNKKKQILYLLENVPPCKDDPCPDYGPTQESALYVIETVAGFAKKEKLATGMTIWF